MEAADLSWAAGRPCWRTFRIWVQDPAQSGVAAGGWGWMFAASAPHGYKLHLVGRWPTEDRSSRDSCWTVWGGVVVHVVGRLGACASVCRRLINAGCAKDRLTGWGIITVRGGDVGVGPRRALPAALGGLWGKAGVVLGGGLLWAPTVGRGRR